MVTLMTVGYGDAVPTTIWGKSVAAITMLGSVVITALPISVIGANFTQRWLVYRDDASAKAREETMLPSFLTLVAALDDCAKKFAQMDDLRRRAEARGSATRVVVLTSSLS